MTPDDVRNASSMPLFSPSYPRGPYHFIRLEYLIITCESDLDAIRAGQSLLLRVDAHA